MRVARLVRLLAGCLTAIIALPTLSQDTPSGDGGNPLAARLDARDIRYQVDADGEFKVTHAWHNEGRSQLVHVAGNAEQAGERRLRKLFSPAAPIGEDGLEAEVASALLRDNSQKILGYWVLNDAYLLYAIQVADDIDTTGLEIAIGYAAQIADEKEIELSNGKDI